MRKFFRLLSLTLLLVITGALTYALITAPPILTGMAAKTMCSCVYVMNRTPESVVAKELEVFPGLSFVPVELNPDDSSATASLLWETSKAIYRKRLGCTLLAKKSEEEVRQQRIKTSIPQQINQDTIPW